MLNEQEEKEKEDEEEEELRTKRRRLDSSGQELGSGSEETPGETKRWLLTSASNKKTHSYQIWTNINAVITMITVTINNHWHHRPHNDDDEQEGAGS